MATRMAQARQRERRREELLDAADRIVQRRGPDVSMDEIASEAGITKPILYRHFGDKDGLYEALAERYVEELSRAIRPAIETTSPRGRLAAGIDAYLAYIERRPERYRFLLGAVDRPGASALLAEFRRGQVADCAGTAEENLRHAGLDPEVGELWAHCVSGMVRSAGIWWLETRSLSRAQLVEHLTALLWEGVPALRRPAPDLDVTGRNRIY
ncbi:MAG TPA: TetR/AcrR family transcriptional regulator [Gaiellaceae bacterium]|jgi:AcrR family transcriptional regulator|nr:TetR/AcrR family transcriptional regulator [Gaiellaceae bacterium]